MDGRTGWHTHITYAHTQTPIDDLIWTKSIFATFPFGSARNRRQIRIRNANHSNVSGAFTWHLFWHERNQAKKNWSRYFVRASLVTEPNLNKLSYIFTKITGKSFLRSVECSVPSSTCRHFFTGIHATRTAVYMSQDNDIEHNFRFSVIK